MGLGELELKRESVNGMDRPCSTE